MFASDLMKELNFLCEIQFVKVSSYHGTQSSGKVQELFGLNQPITNRNIVIVEDIIDSGLTLHFLKQELQKQNPASIQICSLLLKPDALQVKLDVHFTGFEVTNEFLVGYGLDYDGLGRNLRHIYQLS
jgi:hypoxanthine phosphoribosyltransferase